MTLSILETMMQQAQLPLTFRAEAAACPEPFAKYKALTHSEDLTHVIHSTHTRDYDDGADIATILLSDGSSSAVLSPLLQKQCL